MYSIDKKPYGYLLTFSGKIDVDEMQKWVDESKRVLQSAPSKFGVVVDMREMKLLSPESQSIMEKGQKEFKLKGLERSCVILASQLLTTQFKNIAKETGIYSFERYINADQNSSWESQAEAWIKSGVDPDMAAAA